MLLLAALLLAVLLLAVLLLLISVLPALLLPSIADRSAPCVCAWLPLQLAKEHCGSLFVPNGWEPEPKISYTVSFHKWRDDG